MAGERMEDRFEAAWAAGDAQAARGLLEAIGGWNPLSHRSRQWTLALSAARWSGSALWPQAAEAHKRAGAPMAQALALAIRGGDRAARLALEAASGWEKAHGWIMAASEGAWESVRPELSALRGQELSWAIGELLGHRQALEGPAIELIELAASLPDPACAGAALECVRQRSAAALRAALRHPGVDEALVQRAWVACAGQGLAEGRSACLEAARRLGLDAEAMQKGLLEAAMEGAANGGWAAELEALAEIGATEAHWGAALRAAADWGILDMVALCARRAPAQAAALAARIEGGAWGGGEREAWAPEVLAELAAASVEASLSGAKGGAAGERPAEAAPGGAKPRRI